MGRPELTKTKVQIMVKSISVVLLCPLWFNYSSRIDELLHLG